MELLAGLEDLAVMGYAEVARRLPFFLRLRSRVRRLLRDREVGLVIPVDYPGFNLPLARDAHREGRRVLYYIAPQVWAWREGRARRLARSTDRVLTVLPFEGDLLHAYGVDARFVGHPLLDEPQPGAPNPAEGGGLIGIFPGSRAQEVRRILPAFAEAARRLAREHPGLGLQIARAPHLPPALYEPFGLPVGSTADTVARSRLALTKSGTITLELALAAVPMVVGYRTSALTYALARRVVRVRWIALANLVAGDGVVPELIQGELTADNVVDAAAPLLDPSSGARAAMRVGLARVRGRLGEPGSAKRVADHALELLS